MASRASHSFSWTDWKARIADIFRKGAGCFRPRPASRPGLRFRPGIEPLEDRQLLSTFVVNTTQDESDQDLPNDPDGPDGLMSLREAILAANDNAGADRIEFST